MTGILQRLKNGESICPKCCEVGPYHTSNNLCGNNCVHNNGGRVEVITWGDVIEGLPNESKEGLNRVNDNFPEVAEAAARFYDNPPAEAYGS